MTIGWLSLRHLSVRLVVVTTMVSSLSPARADTFSAGYQARMSGISIGSGHLTGDLKAGTYTATLRGDVSLLGISTRFVASSNGISRDAKILPARYQLRTEGVTERTVTVDFLPDRTAAVSIEPSPTESEKRGLVPLEDAAVDVGRARRRHGPVPRNPDGSYGVTRGRLAEIGRGPMLGSLTSGSDTSTRPSHPPPSALFRAT